MQKEALWHKLSANGWHLNFKENVNILGSSEWWGVKKVESLSIVDFVTVIVKLEYKKNS